MKLSHYGYAWSSRLASLLFSVLFLFFFFSMQEHDVEQKCLEITPKHAFLGIFLGGKGGGIIGRNNWEE